MKKRFQRLICWVFCHDFAPGIRSEPIYCGMCTDRVWAVTAVQCLRCQFYDRPAMMRWVRHHQLTEHTSYIARIHKLRQVTEKNGATAYEAETAARFLKRLQAQTTQYDG